jgi:hypothetical protein
MVTRGFTGRQSGSELSDRIRPGQHLVDNFPVLAAGLTPRIEPANWTFTLKIGPRPVFRAERRGKDPASADRAQLREIRPSRGASVLRRRQGQREPSRLTLLRREGPTC